MDQLKHFLSWSDMIYQNGMFSFFLNRWHYCCTQGFPWRFQDGNRDNNDNNKDLGDADGDFNGASFYNSDENFDSNIEDTEFN